MSDGVLWEASQGVLENVWGPPRGLLGPPWGLFLGGLLEASWGLVGGGGLLGASWAVGSKCPFGFSLEAPASDHPGALVAWFGILLGNFGAILGCVGALLGLLGSWALGGSGDGLGASGAVLDAVETHPTGESATSLEFPRGCRDFCFLDLSLGGSSARFLGAFRGSLGSRAFLRPFWASWRALGPP